MSGFYANQSAAVDYLTDIEDTFVRCRGANLFISPKDWQLIETWEKRGIPQHIVIRSIEDVFEKHKGGKVSTLAYCSNAVEENFANWSASQIGANSGVSLNDEPQLTAVADYIRQCIDQLLCVERPEMRQAIEAAIQRLTAISASLSQDMQSIDEALMDVENALARAMSASLQQDERERLERSVTGHLATYKKDMTDEAYQNTFDLMYMKSLRDSVGVPRLGLFYL